MTYTEILNLIMDDTKTDYQKAADVHALVVNATRTSALNLKPMKERAKRGPNKAKLPTDPRLESQLKQANGHDSTETEQ